MLQDRSIGLEIVAAQAGHRTGAGIAPPAKPGNHGAKRGARHVPVFGIMANVRMGPVEAARCRVNEIAAFGDGHRDNPDPWVGNGLNQGCIIGIDWNIVDHRPDNFGSPAMIRVKLDKRGQAILRQQGLTHCPVIFHDAGTDDSPVMGTATLHQAMHIPGKMRPVEIPDTDMDNSGRYAGPVI